MNAWIGFWPSSTKSCWTQWSLLNSLKYGENLSRTMLQASIVVLPKPDKDNQSWANFRQISLHNVAINILPKVLATWLNHILHCLVHRDQVDFEPLRQAADIIRWTLLLTHIAHYRAYQLILLFFRQLEGIQHLTLDLPKGGLDPQCGRPLPQMDCCLVQRPLSHCEVLGTWIIIFPYSSRHPPKGALYPLFFL